MNKVSEQQLRANRINAQLGGVKTEAGKSISCQNSVVHNILGNTVSEYENIAYEPILEQLEADFPPSNILEQMILGRIVSSHIKLIRISKAENELMQTALNPTVGCELSFAPRYQGYEPVITPELVEKMSLYSRYETATENKLYKAMQQLMILKKLSNQNVYEQTV